VFQRLQRSISVRFRLIYLPGDTFPPFVALQHFFLHIIGPIWSFSINPETCHFRHFKVQALLAAYFCPEMTSERIRWLNFIYEVQDKRGGTEGRARSHSFTNIRPQLAIHRLSPPFCTFLDASMLKKHTLVPSYRYSAPPAAS